jgi:Electron transfer DM13
MTRQTAVLPPRPRTPVGGRLLAAIGMVVLLVAGVFFFGRLADDEQVARGLTAAWFGAVFVGGYLVTRRRLELRLPLASAFGAVAIAFALFVVLPSIRDKEVNERVVTGAPASGALRADERRGGPAEPGGPRPGVNVQLASGSFAALAHDGQGTAAVVELASGERKLTLTEFETDAGPDLRVYVSTDDPAEGGELGDFVDLGGLKGNKGNQQYTLPAELDIGRYQNVVIWCRAFSVGFTSAPLAAS